MAYDAGPEPEGDDAPWWYMAAALTFCVVATSALIWIWS